MTSKTLALAQARAAADLLVLATPLYVDALGFPALEHKRNALASRP